MLIKYKKIISLWLCFSFSLQCFSQHNPSSCEGVPPPGEEATPPDEEAALPSCVICVSGDEPSALPSCAICTSGDESELQQILLDSGGGPSAHFLVKGITPSPAGETALINRGEPNQRCVRMWERIFKNPSPFKIVCFTGFIIGLTVTTAVLVYGLFRTFTDDEQGSTKKVISSEQYQQMDSEFDEFVFSTSSSIF